jgi:hypothetical protein
MERPRGHVVFIVDDDRRIREALALLLSSFDMNSITFGSAGEYMGYPRPDVPTLRGGRPPSLLHDRYRTARAPLRGR